MIYLNLPEADPLYEEAGGMRGVGDWLEHFCRAAPEPTTARELQPI